MADQPFRFLDLPPETRYEIYAFYLFPSGDRKPWTSPHLGVYLGWEPFGWWTASTDIFRVSKRISLESRMIFYENFVLRAQYQQMEHLYQFLQFIGRENRHALRKLEIGVPHGDVLTGNLERSNRQRGEVLGLLNTFDLLSRGHSLGYLLLRFNNHDDLVAFFESERTTEHFSKLKNVVNFEVKVGQDNHENEGTTEQQRYLKKTTQKLRDKVQIPTKVSLARRRTRLQANQLRVLLDHRDDMVARQEASKKEAEYFDERSKSAAARSLELATQIGEVEKSIEKVSSGDTA